MRVVIVMNSNDSNIFYSHCIIIFLFSDFYHHRKYIDYVFSVVVKISFHSGKDKFPSSTFPVCTGNTINYLIG